MVIRECAQFPNGEYDDWVDTVPQAIIWMRKTYHLEFKDEEGPIDGIRARFGWSMWQFHTDRATPCPTSSCTRAQAAQTYSISE
jgi:hypothetical protein